MASRLREIEQAIAAAKRDAESLIALELELAAVGVSAREANQSIAARRRTLRQDFKQSPARNRWYDEHDYDNDCYEAWDSVGTERHVRHIQALLADSTGHS
ncbi:MAG: hypothetical protein F4117_04865 [Acidimicrobiales bacterium]|nr:hypothetical protein [Acidimicrobiaceae bacterium]MXV87541.1 hypothetical protein [Acidimicrobiales bacterium]MDE0678445.1 hypothetical protein [Acidimicrobiaceae bacterium]MXX43125.1 hypothetical protein [Acidimicrobiales bacterium]MXY02113.1 hypothetical protein [Acidimicrobiales bacterium]